MNTDCILEKIKNSDFRFEPFKYLYIDNFIPEDDFNKILITKEVLLKEAQNDEQLLNILKDNNWIPISFPGSTTNLNDYINWKKNNSDFDNVNTCEGFGITFRLKEPQTNIIKKYLNFFESYDFKKCLCEKFQIKLSETTYDTGFQKYLDGYEISPHPDVRKKALTFMINVNSNPNSHNEFHHCNFNTFKPEKKYVEEYWKYNINSDRCWVPWDWCDTKFLHNKNNSITIFSPDNNTLHSVKAKYNHLKYQRTQFYGNLWYKKEALSFKPNWEDFVINASKEQRTSNKLQEKINRQSLF